MDPTIDAADPLVSWQRALQEQHEAEQHLEAALARGSSEGVELGARAELLRLRADLLLAEAAKAQAHARDRQAGDDRAGVAGASGLDLDLPPESFSGD